MTIDLGRVTPIYKGDYSAGTTYELNDIVLYSDGNLYWHTEDASTTGILPTDTSVWTIAFSGSGVEAAIEAIRDDAEAIAFGTRGGLPVGSSDPYYHNNAAWHAAAAATAKSDAAGSATESAGSATAAAGSAADAAASATESADSATAAAGSATLSESSADTAAYWAGVAQAAEAENSRINAAQNRRLDNLEAAARGVLFREDTDTAAAYSKTVPAGALPWAEVGSIGGRSILYNQLVYSSGFGESASGWSVSGGTLTAEDGIATYTYTAIGDYYYSNNIRRSFGNGISIPAGHKVLTSAYFMPEISERLSIRIIKGNNFSGGEIAVLASAAVVAGEWNHAIGIGLVPDDANTISLMLRGGSTTIHTVGETVKIKEPVVFDLTLAFGAGNEPESVDDERVSALLAYYAANPVQNLGTPVHAAVTAVVSRRKEVVWNQQVDNGDFSDGKTGWYAQSNRGTLSASGDGVCTYTKTVDGTDSIYNPSIPYVTGHKYFASVEVNPSIDLNVGITCRSGFYSDVHLVPVAECPSGVWTRVFGISNYDYSYKDFSVYKQSIDAFVVGSTYSIRNCLLIDLTLAFGEGNEPESTSDERITALLAYYASNAAHRAYNVGTVIGQTRSNGQIVFVEQTSVDSFPVPVAVRALEGYGQSQNGGAGNVLDLAAMKYTEIGRYVDGEWSALDTPVETDVSGYFDSNSIAVEAGGSITFEQDGTEIPAPNSVTYGIDIREVIGT